MCLFIVYSCEKLQNYNNDKTIVGKIKLSI